MTTPDQTDPPSAPATVIEQTQKIIEGWCSGPGMLST
jgi:hypothetical protein